jgi:hypothetical protein
VTVKKDNYVPFRLSRSKMKTYRRLETAIPESEFTLSAFGLPEPKTVPERSFDLPGGGDYPLTARIPPPTKQLALLWIVLGYLLLAALTAIVYRRYRSSNEE